MSRAQRSGRDFQEILRSAKEQGFNVTLTGNNHYQFKAPNGGGIVTGGGTYGDFRAIRNLVSRLRHVGFVAPKSMR